MICVSAWACGLASCVLPAVQLSQVTVITECSLYAAWEVNASMRSSGYTWTFTQHTQSIVRRQRWVQPAGLSWKVPEEIIYPPVSNKWNYSFIMFRICTKRKSPLVWVTQSLRGGRDEIGSKVMTHHFLPHTQQIFLCRWPIGDSVAGKKPVTRSVYLFWIMISQRCVSTLPLSF